MFARIDFAKLDLMDALDLAILVEIEAMERYQLFTKQLGYSHAGDAYTFFKTMAVNEAKHGEELAQRRKELFGDVPMRVRKEDLYDVEAPDVGKLTWDTSTLQACKIGLDSENKAYSFYDQALPHVKEGPVRELFIELRDEEVEHIRLVKDVMDKLPPGADQPLVDADAD